MNIKIHNLKDNLKEIKGIVVIIDVFRACTTIPILFSQGAIEIIPVRTAEETKEYMPKRYVLIGEGEYGSVNNVFDYNNSPSEIYDKDFSGKKIVLRTNNATQAIFNSNQASDIILASFVNLGAVVQYIYSCRVKNITLVPLGRMGEKGLEDELCAKAIKYELEEKYYNFEDMRRRIYKCKCAVLVRNILKRPKDVEMGLKLNSYPIVPKVYFENNHKIIKFVNK